MIKSCCLLYLVCFTSVCFAQTKETYYGEVLTKTGNSGITGFLYCRNNASNWLSVYAITNGVVSGAPAYEFTQAKNRHANWTGVIKNDFFA